MANFYKIKYSGKQLAELLDQIYDIPYSSGDGIILAETQIQANVTTMLYSDGLYYWYINGDKTNIVNPDGEGATAPTATIGENGFWYLNGQQTNLLVPSGKSISLDPNYAKFTNYLTTEKVNEQLEPILTDIANLKVTKQDSLNAGDWITIQNNTISTSVDIPTQISDLPNDVGYITLADVHIPTKISEFENDTGFVTMKDVTDYTDEAFASKETYTEVSGSDLNTLLTAGKYKVTGAVNYPGTASGGYLDVENLNGITRQSWESTSNIAYRDGSFVTISTIHENDFYVNGIKQTVPEDNIILLKAGTKENKASYTLSGYLNGSIKIVYPDGVSEDANITDDTELRLNNLTINANSATKVIDYPFTEGKLIIFLEPNSYNYIINRGTASSTRIEDAVIYSENDVIIQGYGGLSINSNLGNHGVKGNDIYIQGNPTIKVNVVHDAFHGSKSVEIDYGTIRVVGAYDGIQSKNNSENEGHVRILGGDILISNCTHGGIGAKTSGFVCNSLTKITFSNNAKNVLNTADGMGTISFLEDITIEGDPSIQKTPFTSYYGTGGVYNAVENEDTGEFQYDAVSDKIEPVGDTYTIENEKAVVLVTGYVNGRIIVNGKSSDIILKNAYVTYAGDAPTIYYTPDGKKLAVKTIDDSLNYVVQNAQTQPSGDCDAIKSENNLQFSSNGYLIAHSTFGDAADGSDFTVKSDGAKYFINSGERGIKGTTLFIGEDSDDVAEGKAENSYVSIYALGNNQESEFGDIFARNGKGTKGTYTVYNFMKGLVTCDTFKSIDGATSVTVLPRIYAKTVDNISTGIGIYNNIDYTILDGRKMFKFNNWTVYENSITLSQKIEGLATKVDVDKLIKTVGDGLQVGDSEHTTNINTTEDNKVMINSVGEVIYSTPYPGDETRKVVQFKNNDQLSGVTTTGAGVPLLFVSKWDKVEVGGSGVSLNLNGKDARPTYNDEKELALKEDIPDISTLATKQDLTDIINGAPEEYNTLKEIAEWIKSDESGSAAMASDIATLKSYFTDGSANKALADQSGNNIETTYTKISDFNSLSAEVETKQDTLVSGTNIKTINGNSLIGSGNIELSDDTVVIDIGTINTSGGTLSPDVLSEINNAISEDKNIVIKASADERTHIFPNVSYYRDTLSCMGILYNTFNEIYINFFNISLTTGQYITGANNIQQKLVSGTNIKTVNGQTLLGSGNIEISGEESNSITIDLGTLSSSGGTLSSEILSQINNNLGNKSITFEGTSNGMSFTTSSYAIAGNGLGVSFLQGNVALTLVITLTTGSYTISQATLLDSVDVKTINGQSIVGDGTIAVQEPLVSGTNIKTVNGNSLLGSGNLEINVPLVISKICSGQSVLSTDPEHNTAVFSVGLFNRTPIIGDTLIFYYKNTTYDTLDCLYAEVTNVADTGVTILIKDMFNCKLSSLLPSLPADASTKTYVLKAVNGVMTWVEETV